MGAETGPQTGERREGDMYLNVDSPIEKSNAEETDSIESTENQEFKRNDEDDNLKNKPNMKKQQAKIAAEELEARIQSDTNNQPARKSDDDLSLRISQKLEDQMAKKFENSNRQPDKVVGKAIELNKKMESKAKLEKELKNTNLELNRLAAEEKKLKGGQDVTVQQGSKVDTSNSQVGQMAAEETGEQSKPDQLENRNDQPDNEEPEMDSNTPKDVPEVAEESASNRRRKRDESGGEMRDVTSQKLSRTRRRVIDFEDESYISEPDVNNVVVGFHGINYNGDASDVLASNEEMTDEEDTLVDENDYGGVEGDSDDMPAENLLELDAVPDYEEDCNQGEYDEYDDPSVEGFEDYGEKSLEDTAPVEDLEAAHAVKLWDDVGADIEMYAAPDRDSPEEIMHYKDPVKSAEQAQMDTIGTGRDLSNELEAELLTPKNDPVIEGLVAPGIRQEERDTIKEARLLDAIPSLNSIEDVSGVLKAAGRDLQQELRLGDVGVNVDSLLDEGDLDPFNELLDDTSSDVINQKYLDFFGKNTLSAPVQNEVRDIVSTRQKADKAFKTLRNSESLVDEASAESRSGRTSRARSSTRRSRRARPTPSRSWR
ncbi:hypothetical protein EGW08_017848 [Elysia chlorotica]|uniref:Uncharacterized protein n=1 Tax=Elysia chlorotica TaxID=188477 RepID=A0A3S1B3W6_ELYCH|nr:hypothetical protein EGW08_017848 [Elysia chlorotica]